MLLGVSSKQSGANNSNWKGGRSVASNGYVLIRVGVNHHLADVRGYAYEHRLVAERMLGRRLREKEEVHHKDKNKENNHESNLEIHETRAHHRVEHRKDGSNLQMPGEPNVIVRCACGCGTALAKYDETGRPRLFLPGHNPQPAPTVDAIIASLSDGPRHRREIIKVTGLGEQAVAVSLSKLKRRGLVESVQHGVWRLSGEQ